MRRLVFWFLMAVSITALGQSTPDKGAEKPISVEPRESTKKSEDSFGDYVKKAGQGIWRRIKVRFNLDQRGEEIKRKSQKILRKDHKEKAKVVNKTDLDSLKIEGRQN